VPGASITQTTYNGQPALQLTYNISPSSPLNSSSTSGTIMDPVGLAVALSIQAHESAPDTGFGQPSSVNFWFNFSVYGSISVGLLCLGLGLCKLSASKR
jgi:hypothetical protein